MKHKKPWNIQHECVLIADCYDRRMYQCEPIKQQPPIKLSGFAKVLLLYIIRVVGAASAVVAILWLAPINLGAGIISCLVLCALFAWADEKIENHKDSSRR